MSSGASRVRRAQRCACWLLLVVWGCAVPLQEPSELRTDAARAMQRGRDAAEARRFEVSEAAHLRAAEIYAALDDAPAEADARFAASEASRRAGRIDEACAQVVRALALDRGIARESAVARDLAGLARCESARGRLDVAIDHADEALELARGEAALEAALQSDLALLLLRRASAGDAERSRKLLLAALRTSELQADARGAATARLHLGSAALALGDAERAQSELQHALEAFRALDDPAGIAHAHEALAVLYARRDEDRARYHREQAREGFAFLEDEAGLARLGR